jgi:hypothetical protein
MIFNMRERLMKPARFGSMGFYWAYGAVATSAGEE